ncbi:MAG: glyoxalase [Marinilabiliales bacterium]|nr:MAG: glyoxalase [Marinilabiliales bacterium]
MKQNLQMAALGVTDLQKYVTFYTKCLKWRISDKSTGDLVIFNVGGLGLALYPIDELAKDANVPNNHQGFSGVTFSFMAKSEKEVDTILSEIKLMGGTITKPAEKVFWGGYSGYFQDPDGYLFEVAFNPFWEMDENGKIDF